MVTAVIGSIHPSMAVVVEREGSQSYDGSRYCLIKTIPLLLSIFAVQGAGKTIFRTFLF